jgi:hypothetical protein
LHRNAVEKIDVYFAIELTILRFVRADSDHQIQEVQVREPISSNNQQEERRQNHQLKIQI